MELLESEGKCICPLCDADMPLTVLESPNSMSEGKTYMWICNECPGVLVEWHDSSDTEALTKYLHHNKGVYDEDNQ